MGVYLDIDLDYLVKPVKNVGINNIRLYRDEYGEVKDVENFIEILKKNVLREVKDKKFFTNHRKSYTYWWIKRLKNMTLVHIDAHSDMYRNKNRDLTYLRDTDMNCDDYIWYAIRDGFISDIYWIVPEGLYNLSEEKTAQRFISESMLKDFYFKDGVLNIIFDVITREGIKNINYKITTIENLPHIGECELLTVATSPEFISQMTDTDIYRTLGLLGANDDDILRIKRIHDNMK